MAAALRGLGVDVTDTADGDWVVDGVAGPLQPRVDRVDVGNAGTVARFLPPSRRSRAAPSASTATRACASGRSARCSPPCARSAPTSTASTRLPVDRPRHGRRCAAAPVVLDASQSSQFVSGLLLAAPRFEQGVDVRHDGGPLPSAPHLAMTVEALRGAGARGRRRRARPLAGRPRPAAARATPSSSPTCRRPRPTSRRRWSPAAR